MLRPLRLPRVSLTEAVSCSFALRTHQETLIRKVQKENLTRAELQTRIEQPNQAEVQHHLDLKLKQQQFEQQLFSQPFNDLNPNNFLKLQIVPFQAKELVSQTIEHLVPHKPKYQKVLVTGMRRECYLNFRKIFPYARPLIGKHVLEAIAIMSQSDKKVGIYLLSALKMVKSHAVQKGLDEDRLFVHAIITNKQRRSFRLRYHAKSKMGRMKSDVCQVRVILEEKPAREMFKSILSAKPPQILVSNLRDVLLHRNAGLENVQKFQYVLTAKGRQQAKLMIKRKAQEMYLQKKAEGKLISLDYLVERIVEEKAIELEKQYEQTKLKQIKFSLSERQTVFKKNEETYR